MASSITSEGLSYPVLITYPNIRIEMGFKRTKGIKQRYVNHATAQYTRSTHLSDQSGRGLIGTTNVIVNLVLKNA